MKPVWVMATDFLILISCAAFTVGAVHFLIIRGIDTICFSLRMSDKLKGQLIGYVTSVPELAVVIVSAFNGVFAAGFWNIASSNIINWVLFISALFAFRQQRNLFHTRFIDEMGFGLLSVIIPLVMNRMQITPSWHWGLMLFALFVVYKVADRRLNMKGNTIAGTAEHGGCTGSVRQGVLLIVAGLTIILVSGHFLGDSAQRLIVDLGTPSWMIGWILGIITSLPELTSFFEIYHAEKKYGRQHLLSGTQQALDALVSSNMCNLCLILPAGMILYGWF